MPTKLTNEQRAQREADRKELRAVAIKAGWQETLTRTAAFKEEADRQFKRIELNAREFWLVLGVFEAEEKDHLAGVSQSVRTKWMDRIAPRARGDSYGVDGFSARTAAKLPEFLKGSKNGYVYLTDLGYALIQLMRERFPELCLTPSATAYQPVPLAGYFEVPSPLWRRWLPGA